MDPLGAPSQFVDVDTLQSWGDSYKDELNSNDSTAKTFQEDNIRSPFLYNRGCSGLLDGAAGGLSAWAMDAVTAPVPRAGPPEGLRLKMESIY